MMKKRKASEQSQSKLPKKKKAKVVDEVDEAIVRNLEELCQRRSSCIADEEELFGQAIAATLRRFNLCQRAMAKLRIENVLMEIEFPES